MTDDVIAIETSEEIASYIQQQDLNYERLEKKAIDGDVSVYAYVLTISTILLPKIVLLLRDLIKARKSVKVSFKGVTIQGVSESNLPRLIELLKDAGKN